MDFIELYYYFCRVVLRDFMADSVALAEVLRLFAGYSRFERPHTASHLHLKSLGKYL